MSEFETVTIAGLAMLSTVKKNVIKRDIRTQSELLSFIEAYQNKLESALHDTNMKNLFNLLKSEFIID